MPVLLAISSIVVGGCSPPGTGTVKVEGRQKIQEKLTQGARAPRKGGATDEVGIRFRKKE